MERVESIQRERERVGLVKLERVRRLWPNIDPDHIEARAIVTDTCAAGTTK
jgi:hypothetical protein